MGTYTLGAFCPGSACSRPSTNSTRLRVACAAHREARAASVGSSQYVGPVPSSSPAYRLSVHPSASPSTHASCRFSLVFLSLPLRPDRLATSAFPALSYIPSILPACTCASSSSCFFARPGPYLRPRGPRPASSLHWLALRLAAHLRLPCYPEGSIGPRPEAVVVIIGGQRRRRPLRPLRALLASILVLPLGWRASEDAPTVPSPALASAPVLSISCDASCTTCFGHSARQVCFGDAPFVPTWHPISTAQPSIPTLRSWLQSDRDPTGKELRPSHGTVPAVVRLTATARDIQLSPGPSFAPHARPTPGDIGRAIAQLQDSCRRDEATSGGLGHTTQNIG